MVRIVVEAPLGTAVYRLPWSQYHLCENGQMAAHCSRTRKTQ